MTETGIWSADEANKYHQNSPKLAEWLKNYLDHNEVVYDFGCGTGYYLNHLYNNDFVVHGYEGTKHIRMDCHDHFVDIVDLTSPIEEFPLGCGSVISLEVGEHLPKWAEQTFLNTITEACDTDLVISWALPSQPGIGHVNCQPKEYIVSEIERRGFKFLPEVTEDARKNIDPNCDWFERTLLVFERA